MAYATVDGLTMYYEEHGRRDGAPLVLLHHFLGTAWFWKQQLPAFGERYRLIVPDLRGHGRTHNPGGLAAMNHHQFARDIIGLCRALGIEQAIFVGESSGGMLLHWLAVDAPGLARALVLAGVTYVYDDELRAWWRGQTPESILRLQDPVQMAEHTALGPEHPRLVAEAFLALAGHAHGDDFPDLEQLRAIAVPALIVHGDRDFFFPVDVPVGLYRLLQDAELCILPNTGHVPPRERPAWFNAIVLDFLARRVPASP
jgi:pimeloyl-ACP methyl ester carboxylesterase